MAAAFVVPDLASAAAHNPGEINVRRGQLDSALGTMAAEGDVPDAETLKIMERYVACELTLAEMGAAVQQHVSQMSHGS